MGHCRFASGWKFLMIVVATLVGIGTHLAWDSFTHPNTWVYRTLPGLHAPLDIPILGATPIYKIFQHGSTLFGIAVLSIWFLLWYRRTEPSYRAPGNPVSRR